jgi:tetratricopeptide (TPR) repeat protein
VALTFGPTPADEALRVLDAALPENPDPASLLSRAELLAMLNRFDEAWPLARRASSRARELTGAHLADPSIATVAALAGDHEAAASHLRRFCGYCEEHGLRGQLSTHAPMLGRSLSALGRHEEAERLAELGRELGDEQMLWRQAKARVQASRGEHAEAERLAREAVTFSARTDALSFQGDACSDLAEVLDGAGRNREATAALEEALERYERKRNLAMADRIRAKLAERRPSPAPVQRA